MVCLHTKQKSLYTKHKMSLVMHISERFEVAAIIAPQNPEKCIFCKIHQFQEQKQVDTYKGRNSSIRWNQESAIFTFSDIR